MTDIFLSYDDKDRPRARALVAALEERGWSIFWDRSIPAGKTWWQAIGRALKGSRSVVVLWSHTAVQSTWVYEEADDGRRRGILVPVFIDPVLPPLGLRSVQAVDLSAWDGSRSDPAFQKLVTDIGAVIGAPDNIAHPAPAPHEMAAPEGEGADDDHDDNEQVSSEEEGYSSEEEGYSSNRFYLLLMGVALGSVLAVYLWG